jgi:hypothetical protein
MTPLSKSSYKSNQLINFYLLCITVTPKILNGCPPLESAVYQVSVTNSNTILNGGCAYINYNSSDVMRQSFSLWFTSIKNVEQRCQNQGKYNKL